MTPDLYAFVLNLPGGVVLELRPGDDDIEVALVKEDGFQRSFRLEPNTVPLSSRPYLIVEDLKHLLRVFEQEGP